jgi:hypothetical protein
MIQETRDVGAVIKKFDEDNYRQTSKIGSMETFRKTTKLHDCGPLNQQNNSGHLSLLRKKGEREHVSSWINHSENHRY